MKTTPEALLERIYTYTKQQGELGTSKYRSEYFLTLPNGVVVMATMEDAGYYHTISVAHLFQAGLQYEGKVNFWYGNKDGMLTVARMIGFQVDF